ncbi:hypothetical protein S7335_375 [Synechococcus sp. PCC 7335]|uniref:WD40 domain-containing protein n=1 Tax=Synechococcus sp. (strain ATCC 29403 / PCC 7335) TaxID=91464 RepID=UPI00017EB1A8|nr:NB-ARC domain-containing protein [Synechococcus sp. PCC 7335]EDX83196.1 hypothetical protein S7335_375 [Synechococcus sp. PCC 7335]
MTKEVSTRRRGVVLTPVGKARLERAMQDELEKTHPYKIRFTLENLTDRTGLSKDTVAKVLAAEKTVDKGTLNKFFGAFDITLEESDYVKPTNASERVQVYAPKTDWGEKPNTSFFVGREQEISLLTHWVKGEKTRIITLLGIGGIGKTMLAAKLSDHLQHNFEYIIWRSLREAPPLSEILIHLIQFLSNQDEIETNLPTRLGERINCMLKYLREHRCLIILDNLEAILQAEIVGEFRQGYDEYGKFLKLIGKSEHNSCLILTSREHILGLSQLEGPKFPVRHWPVKGLKYEASLQILKAKGLTFEDSNQQADTLIARSGGNPQILSLVSTDIKELFFGDISDFLQEQVTVLENVQTLLSGQVNRLTHLEQLTMYWLAINREPVSIDELMKDLLPSISKHKLRVALSTLSKRSLIEVNSLRFTLQNVVMEYITEKLVQQSIHELRECEFNRLHNHSLIKASAKDYVRETQIRLILRPVANSIENSHRVIINALQNVRQHIEWKAGYISGNLLNLVTHSKLQEKSFDFSELTLRQIHLTGVSLRNQNLAYTSLIQSSLTHTFHSLYTVAWSPNRNFLATGDAIGNVQLWSVENRQQLATFKGHANWIRSVAFSPNGQLLASSSGDSTVRLWDVKNKTCIHVFEGHMDGVRTVAFSPNGQLLASGSGDSTVRLWDVKNKTCIHVFEGHMDGVRTVAFSHDSKLLASGSEDCSVRVWNVEERLCLYKFTGEKNCFWAVAFSPDGKFIAGSENYLIRLWDIERQECAHTFEGHRNWIWAVAFSPDGRFMATGSADTTVRLWDVQRQQCEQVLEGHNSWIQSVHFSPEGRNLVSASNDGTIRLWETHSGKCVHVFEGYTNGVLSVTFSPDSMLVASGSEETNLVRLWDIQRCQCVHLFEGHTKWVWSVAFSSDGKFLATGSADTTIRLWNISNKECVFTFEGHTNWVRSVAFDPSSHYLASSSEDATVRLWHLHNRECIHVFEGHTSWVRSAVFSPDGNCLASASNDGTIRLWDVSKLQCIHTFEGHTNGVWSVAFSPDGQFLASGSADNTVRLWNLRTNQCVQVFEGHTNWVWPVAFSPDGQLLASGSADATVRLWNFQKGKYTRILRGHTSGVRSIHFSSDSLYLVSGSHDGTIRIWNTQTGTQLNLFQSPRPYEGTNITGIQGLTEEQRFSMISLGAIGGNSSK